MRTWSDFSIRKLGRDGFHVRRLPSVAHRPHDQICNRNRSPTAGGQYHWVSEFAPPRMQELLSYLTGE